MAAQMLGALKVKGTVLLLGGNSDKQGAGASISPLDSFAALQAAELSSDTLYALPSEEIPLTSNESALDATISQS